jgi:outer membrane protein TolC
VATPVTPAQTWTPSGSASTPLRQGPPSRVVPAPLATAQGAQTLRQLSLTDVVDLALSNSPQTRATWAQARAAAATVGSARGHYLPTLTLDAVGGPSQIISANPARAPANRSIATTSVTLQYALFDFGARGGSVSAAREALYAADLSHNATVQNVVLEAENAYFSYQASRGLMAAAHATVETAKSNLAAAERRHDVGLATIADVLAARTALAQAQLAELTAEGNMQTARASMALAVGLSPTVDFDVTEEPDSTPVFALTESVDSLISRAERLRPDVAAARALARQGDAQVRVARSLSLPTLNLGATGGRAYANVPTLEGQTYALTVGVSIPLFNGLSRQYDVVTAQENAAAAAARADQLGLQAAAQVYASYFALRTATQRISTAAELLAQATRSEEVARGRYAEGVGTALDLLSAQSALADARAQSVQARWTWFATFAQLARDAGVLTPRSGLRLSLLPDTTQFNSPR